jgi:vacuolar iron transporter family protein
MDHDALGAHARDELGLTKARKPLPLQAAFASALSFSIGAALPLAAALLSPEALLAYVVPVTSLGFLAGLGALAARMGGAPMGAATLRVTFWGALAMGITAAAGALFGAA